MKKLAVLGATGSIGSNTLALVDQFPDEFKVSTLTAQKKVEPLAGLIAKYHPELVVVGTEEAAKDLRARCPGTRIEWGADALESAVEPADIVVTGIIGFAALAPTLHAVRLGKTIALANKEVLVVAGPLLLQEQAKSGALCIPVDSEHNALYQLLKGVPRNEVETLVLTASGGPLFRHPELKLEDVTPEFAVAHPNWKMGPKISVDSATLINKGLELIEAHVLFGFPQSKIEVWVHPQSIVHGAIWLTDNSCLAQLSKPDMRSSIGYALAYPHRLPKPIPKLSFADFAKLEFHAPDDARFPGVRLARQALDSSPSHLVSLNAANEIAVEAFLRRETSYPSIPRIIEEALASEPGGPVTSIEHVRAVDAEARRRASDGVARHRA